MLKKTEQVWLGKREEFTVAFNKNKGCGWVGWDGWLGWLGVTIPSKRSG